jgi:hypothetical protein
MRRGLRRDIFIAIALSLVSCSALASHGQVASNATSKRNTRINIYYHLGSVELPDGFSGYVGANWTDAWGGFIESPKAALRIQWRAGLIEYVLEKRRNEVVWEKEEKLSGFPIKWASLRNKTGNTLVAKIGWLEFSALVSTKEDEETFLSIIRSYKKERCGTCGSLPIRIEN